MIKMGKDIKSPYPDISKILLAKESRRRVLESLSWEEKVSIILKMQKLLPKGKWKEVESHKKKDFQKMAWPINQTVERTGVCSVVLSKPRRNHLIDIFF